MTSRAITGQVPLIRQPMTSRAFDRPPGPSDHPGICLQNTILAHSLKTYQRWGAQESKEGILSIPEKEVILLLPEMKEIFLLPEREAAFLLKAASLFLYFSKARSRLTKLTAPAAFAPGSAAILKRMYYKLLLLLLL